MSRGWRIVDANGKLKIVSAGAIGPTGPAGPTGGVGASGPTGPSGTITVTGVTGVVCETSTGVFETRTITGSAGVTVTDGGGVTGNPTIGMSATGAILVTGPISITDAQWKSLSSAPLVVVTGGANKYIVPTGFSLRTVINAVYSAGNTVSLRYSGVATDLTTALSLTGAGASGEAWGFADSAANFGPSTGSTSGASIIVRTSADVTSGTGTNIHQLWVSYYIADFN